MTLRFLGVEIVLILSSDTYNIDSKEKKNKSISADLLDFSEMLNYRIKVLKKYHTGIPMSSQGKRITLKDLASICHVSIMTASRAFRRDAVIDPETRSRILRAAGALNYHAPAPRGRPGLSCQKRPRQIQLIFGIRNGNTAYFHMRLLTAVEQQLALRGFECVIRTSTGDSDIFLRLLGNAVRHKCAGTMIMGDFPPEQFTALLDALPGAVLLDAPGDGGTGNACSSFSFDNRSAAVIFRRGPPAAWSG